MMHALSRGLPGGKVVVGEPPIGKAPIVVWGQRWLALRAIPTAIERNRPWWLLDNGYHLPARGMVNGFYRATYRSVSPILLRDPESRRDLRVAMRPWRKDGRHVLLAIPGLDFGRVVGLDMRGWLKTITGRLRIVTDRPVRLRPKGSDVPLRDDLRDAWCLVTHSSNVAVDAVLAGVPVFVEPTSPAAPVGNTNLGDIENPVMPDRAEWWSSLMNQQFTLSEMADGTAWRLMQRIAKQVDENKDVFAMRANEETSD